jgi:hypothetical protein
MREREQGSSLVALPGHKDAWHRIEPWIFYFSIALIFIPLWSAVHFPSQDGPLHLYNAILLRDYARPDRPNFREFFRPNGIVPNWVCPHVLPILLRWFEPATAEKVLLSFYIVLFPISVRYCLASVRKHAAPLAIAALPWVPNQFLHMGFEDFCFSLAAFFITLGYYLGRRHRFGYLNAIVLAGLLLATYLTHLLSAMMLLPLIGLIALYTARSRPHQSLAGIARDLMPVALSMVPLILVTFYFLGQKHSIPSMFAYPKGWLHRFYFLISWMKGLGRFDLVPAMFVLLLFAGISAAMLYCLRRDSGWRWLVGGLSGALLLIACGYFSIFLFASDYIAGGQFVLIRLAAYPMFALLLWWAAVPIPPAAFRRAQVIIAAVSVPSLLMMLALDVASYRHINRYLAEFDAIAPLITPGSTLLPIHFDNYQTMEPGDRHREIAVGIDPFRHAICYGLAERGIINLSNYWASTDHHSVRWQGDLDPLHGGQQDLQNLAAYTRRTGVPIDFIAIWTGGLPHDDLEGRTIREQLRGYELIYRSPQSGYLELYRKTR